MKNLGEKIFVAVVAGVIVLAVDNLVIDPLLRQSKPRPKAARAAQSTISV